MGSPASGGDPEPKKNKKGDQTPTTGAISLLAEGDCDRVAPGVCVRGYAIESGSSVVSKPLSLHPKTHLPQEASRTLAAPPQEAEIATRGLGTYCVRRNMGQLRDHPSNVDRRLVRDGSAVPSTL